MLLILSANGQPQLILKASFYFNHYLNRLFRKRLAQHLERMWLYGMFGFYTINKKCTVLHYHATFFCLNRLTLLDDDEYFSYK